MKKQIAAAMVAGAVGLGVVGVVATSASASNTPTGVVRHDRSHGVGREADKTALANLLGMTTDELHTELRSGKSLAQIAAAQDVSVTKVIDLLLAQAKTRITEMVNTVPSVRSEMRGRLHRGERFGGGNKTTSTTVGGDGA